MFDDKTCPVCGALEPIQVGHITGERLIRGYLRMGLSKQNLSTLFSRSSDEREIWQCRCRKCDLVWFSGAIAGEGEFYEELQKFEWYYQADKPEYGFAQSKVQGASRILEIGCGAAEFRRYLPNDAIYRGLEFNDAAVEIATEKGLDVEKRAIESEAECHPSTYDMVVSFQVLEHVSDPRSFIRCAVRTLKPGGRLLIGVPSLDSFVGEAESCWLNMPPHHLTWWSDLALHNIFLQNGLKEIECWHEPIHTLHLGWSREVAINRYLKLVLGMKRTLAADPFVAGLARLVSKVPAMRNHAVSRMHREFPNMLRGHTVCMLAVRPHD